MGIRWTDRIRKEEVGERTQQVPIGTEIDRRRWKWIEHTLRKPENNIAKKTLDWNPQGKRHQGRPRKTWRRIWDRDVERSLRAWKAVKVLARDRFELLLAYTLRQGEKGNDDDSHQIRAHLVDWGQPLLWGKHQCVNKSVKQSLLSTLVSYRLILGM